MSAIFICLVAVSLISIVAWNVVPVLRYRLRGWTTMTEAAIVAAVPFIGNLIDAFEQTNWREYVPPSAWPYITAALACWFIFKRVVTTTPVGERG